MKNLHLLLLVLALFLTLPRDAEAKKVFIVNVTLKNGAVLRGKLMGYTKDSLTIATGRNLPSTRIAVLDIMKILIHRRGSTGIGIGIGAGAGAILGVIIGFASFTPSDGSSAGGALLGALTGSVIGLGIGSAGREFKIEGNQAQFDLFADHVGSSHH